MSGRAGTLAIRDSQYVLHAEPASTSLDPRCRSQRTSCETTAVARCMCESNRFRRSVETNRNYHLSQLYLAVTLVYLGELDEAKAAAQMGLALHPGFTISRFRASAACDHPAYLAGRERVYEGLRQAGVPEG